MAFMDKLAFWKKKDGADASLGINNPAGGRSRAIDPMNDPLYDPGVGSAGLGNPEGDMGTTFMGSGYTQNPSSMHDDVTAQSFQPIGSLVGRGNATAGGPQFQMKGADSGREFSYGVEKDLEVISAKLDSIRAMLESLNQRVSNIERIAYSRQQPAKESYGSYKW